MRAITPVLLLVMSAAHLASAAPTSTTVTIATPTLVMGETTTATATVTDTSGAPAPPTGTVTWSDGGTSGTYGFTCTLSPLSASASSCSITYGPGGAFSSVTLTATYSGNASHSSSNDSALITVNKRATATAVSPNAVQIAAGSSVVFTATVTDTSTPPSCCFTPDVNPVSAVVWSASPSSLGTFASSGICSLSRVTGSLTDSSCSITYTATATATVTITADYTGDNVHAVSSGTASLSRQQQPPVADAGPDQTTSPGTGVVFDGTASFDPDGGPLTYSWTQTAGPSVSLIDGNTPMPSFTAPPVAAQTTLTFQLTVSDGALISADTVNVIVAASTIFSFETVRSLNGPGAVGTHPTVAVRGSNVYVVWTNNTAAAISFTKSANAGATFGPVLTLSPPASLCTAASPCVPGGASAPVVASSGNHVYVAWVDGNHGVFLASSDDGGATFSGAVNVVPMGNAQGTGVQIAASGTFVHLLSYCINCGPNAATGFGQMVFSTSADSGQTFSTTTLSDVQGGCCGQIALAQNNLYIAFSETTAAGRSVIRFMSSANNGVTLNAAVTLSDPMDTAFSPQIAVAGVNVYVAWHDQTTGQVTFRSSTNGGATFGASNNVLPGALGLGTTPALAADGSNVYALSAAQSMPYPIEYRGSSNSGGAFGTSRTLNDSPLFPSGNSCCAVYPQIVAQGSGVFVVWGALPASVSSGLDIAFTHSTNSGASFSGPINLSHNPDFSQLAYGAGSTYLNKVDGMAVGSGRVHIVWSDGNPANTAWTVKYATGTLVPSAVSIASTGAAYTTVTADPSGNIQISQSNSSGTLVASVTLPPGSSASSGSVTLTHTTSGLIDEVGVSGVTVPYPPGKRVSFLVDAATSAVCINDQPSATVGVAACTTGPNNLPYSLACQANVVTSSGPLTFTSGPGSRTFTCTLVSGAGGNTYAVVGGLAYSAVASVVLPADAVRHLIDAVDGMTLPRGIAQSLHAKLQAALNAIETGQNTTAVKQLNAFINAVAAQSGKQLSPSRARRLTSSARRIVTALSP